MTNQRPDQRQRRGWKSRLKQAHPVGMAAGTIVLLLVIWGTIASNAAYQAAGRVLQRAEYVSDCQPVPADGFSTEDCRRLDASAPAVREDGIEIRDKDLLLAYGQTEHATATAILTIIGLFVAGVGTSVALFLARRRDEPPQATHCACRSAQN